MMRGTRFPVRGRAGLILLLALAAGLAGGPLRPAALAPQSTPVRAAGLDSWPLVFVANAGQADPAAHFLAATPGGGIFFTPGAVVLDTGHGAGASATAPAGSVQVQFVGANAGATLAAGEPQAGRVSYLRGGDPARWHTNLPTYGSVTYTALWPGVSLTYAGRNGRLKGTYTVQPGADPAHIRWRYAGANPPIVDTAGNLEIASAGSALSTQHSALVEQAPVAWQERGGRRSAVPARYLVAADGSVGFALGAYNPALPLTIDPILNYATYLGGSGADTANAVAVDGAGNITLAGTTQSADFPLTRPYQPAPGGDRDAFVARLNPAGSALLYATYLGGSGDDEAEGLTADAAGNAYLTGYTQSLNFPLQNPVQPVCGCSFAGGDAFVAELDPSGARLVFATYLGGRDVDNAHGIALDRFGAVYVAGATASPDFPVTPGAYQPTWGGGDNADAFVAKYAPTGTRLVYATYLGSGGQDEAFAVAVDAAGAAYLTGWTSSFSFPAVHAYQPALQGGRSAGDAFVTKVNPAGSGLDYSTFLGGTAMDKGTGIALDGAGSAYVTGVTTSSDFPLAHPLQAANGGGGAPVRSDAFVTRLAADGASLVYSTYLGGSGEDSGAAIAVDVAGNATVAGNTSSADFPLLDAVDASFHGSDIFVAQMDAAGQRLIYATYFGGSGTNTAGGLALDLTGAVVVAGTTDATDLPLVAPYQARPGGATDAFLARIAPGLGTPVPTVPPPSPIPPPTCSVVFNDVPTGSPFAAAICTLATAGVVSGYGCGSPAEPCPGAYFRPTAPLTRGQAAKIIANSQGPFYMTPTPIPPAQQTFADVPPGSAFWQPVERLASQGILSGYTCGGPGEPCDAARRAYFRPNVAVTRGQLAKIAARGAGYTGDPTIQVFEDIPPGPGLYTWTGELAEHGAISGYSCGVAPAGPCVAPFNRPYYLPGAPVSRGQMAKIVAGSVYHGLQAPAGGKPAP